MKPRNEMTLEELKDSAANNRRFDEFEEALADLDEAIQRLRAAIGSDDATDPAATTKKTGELADCLGMKGGIYRRMGSLDEALRAYKDGLVHEEKVGESSYNLSNLVALSVVKDPSSLPQLLPEIQRGITRITKQNRGDWWAHADLGMFHLLVGDTRKAEEHYEQFDKGGAQWEDYQTTLDVLRKMLASFQAISSPVAVQIDEVITTLSRQQEIR